MVKKFIGMMILVVVSSAAFAGTVGQFTVQAGGVKTAIPLAHEMERLNPEATESGYLASSDFKLMCTIQNPKANNIVAVYVEDEHLRARDITINGEIMFGTPFKTAMPKGQNSLLMIIKAVGGFYGCHWKDIYDYTNIDIWSTSAQLKVDCSIEKIS